ncbi:MAG: RIP metalloprotease RseP [Acidobacteriia bacterium]|nr:RIP metalloprotease RseP [Terriglobia bacterium]
MSIVLGMVLVLGVLILVHEWGHYIMARLFGVRVEVFSIGFGPRLFGWKSGDTDFRVSALPLGGFVRMAGQDMFEVDSGEQTAPTGKPDELMSKPRWQRALISFGGPVVNLLFPILLLFVYFAAVGQPYSKSLDTPVRVTAWPVSSAPDDRLLQLGDKVVALNGVANPSWEDALAAFDKAAPGSMLRIEVENGGVRRTVTCAVKDPEQFTRIFGYFPDPAMLTDLDPALPAFRAGLREGDKITSLNGQPIIARSQFVDSVRASKGQKLAIGIERSGKPMLFDVVPFQGPSEGGESVWLIGIHARGEEESFRRVTLSAAAGDAAGLTFRGSQQVFGVVTKLFTGRISVSQLQGVVGIARLSGQAVRQGVFPLVMLMVTISINLGILNLLPIPILDGGHILLLSIEGLRRRDLSLAFKERFVQVGFVFLVVLFAIVMYHDVARLHLGR